MSGQQESRCLASNPLITSTAYLSLLPNAAKPDWGEDMRTELAGSIDVRMCRVSDKHFSDSNVTELAPLFHRI